MTNTYRGFLHEAEAAAQQQHSPASRASVPQSEPHQGYAQSPTFAFTPTREPREPNGSRAAGRERAGGSRVADLEHRLSGGSGDAGGAPAAALHRPVASKAPTQVLLPTTAAATTTTTTTPAPYYYDDD